MAAGAFAQAPSPSLARASLRLPARSRSRSCSRSCSRFCPLSRSLYMSISRDRGTRNCPWVPVAAIHNALVRNHFLDVLEVHGRAHGLLSDDVRAGYDPAGAYAPRMQRLSAEFRRQVAGAFARRVGFADVACVTKGGGDVDEGARAATREAMGGATRLIVGGVVADEERRLFARVPMLVRADVANEMLDVRLRAPEGEDLGSLYVPVAVKRRPVETGAEGVVKKKCQERTQVEMWLWNELLAREQGADLGAALLVGLHPRRRKAIHAGAVPSARDGVRDVEGSPGRKNGEVFDTTVWNLGVVPFDGGESKSSVAALEALLWRVSVVDDGEDWIRRAVRTPRKIGLRGGEVEGIYALAASADTNKLRPNMKCANFYDWPWSQAKREIAEQLRELTLVSGISQAITDAAMKKGIPNDYSNALATAEAFDIKGGLTVNILEMCKADYDGLLVKPAVIPNNRNNWRRLQGFSQNSSHKFDKMKPELRHAEERTFYVDFELASPEYLLSAPPPAELHDEELKRRQEFFDVEPSLPIQKEVAADSLIFMIGCGQLIRGKWKHRVFLAQSLTVQAESSAIREWLTYMHSVRPPDNGRPILNVWGPEQQLLRKSLKRMTAEDATAVKGMVQFQMVNLLQVVTQACVAIKGNLTNSVKTVCSALEGHGLLDEVEVRSGEKGVANGADAMALGLDAAEVMHRDKLSSLSEAPKMQQIAAYNEADCRAIALIVTYLRKHH